MVREGLGFPGDIPGIVDQHMSHSGMMRNGEGEILPVHRVRTTKRRCVTPRMSAGDGLENDIFGSVTDALAPDHEVEEGLGAEIGFILESGDNHRMS